MMPSHQIRVRRNAGLGCVTQSCGLKPSDKPSVGEESGIVYFQGQPHYIAERRETFLALIPERFKDHGEQ